MSSKDGDQLISENIFSETNFEELLKTNLAILESQNPDAYSILLDKAQKGFFEASHGRATFNDIADQILKTISNQD